MSNSILLGRSPSGRYPIGSQVSYECLDGFTFRGERRLQCAATGCWEGVTPTCHPTPQFLGKILIVCIIYFKFYEIKIVLIKRIIIKCKKKKKYLAQTCKQ